MCIEYRITSWSRSLCSFLNLNLATTGPLEATPEMSQVHSLLSVNIVTLSSLQVVHRFTTGDYLQSVNQTLHIFSTI